MVIGKIGRLFGRHQGKPTRLMPEAKWLVALVDGAIHVTDDRNESKVVALADLSGVTIETNDSGPWGADFWWLLFDDDGEFATAFPQGATGEEPVIAYLETLPGFDYGKSGNAMTSTANARFIVWQR